MTTPFLDTIPTCSRTAAAFISRFEQATPAEVSQVAERIADMTQSELTLFDYHVLPQCFDERLLTLLCESPEVMENTSFLRLSGVFSELFKKQNSLMLEQDVYDRLTASLIDLYPNTRRMNFLQAIGGIVIREGVASHSHKPGPLFDAALARHIEKAPSHDFADYCRAMDSLRDVELPKTLAIFLRQLLANDERIHIITYVSELFQNNNLHESYIEVFKQELGADAFINICVKANDMQGCLPSVLKVIPLAGESAFHHREFIGGLRSYFNRNLPSYYLQEFVEQGMDEKKLPILSEFILENLKPLLGDWLKKEKLQYTIGYARLAANNNHGVQALECVFEGLRAPLSWNMNSALGMTLTEMVNKLTDKALDDFPEPKFYDMWALLPKVVEAIGFETLHRVAPTIDYRFIQHFMANIETPMSKTQIMKLFPHTKGPILEDELGL
jgi:hypothetical protein